MDLVAATGMAALGHAAGDDMLRAVLILAATLGLDITAEGVETLAQLHMLRAQGCHEAQGYYFGKPMSAQADECR